MFDKLQGYQNVDIPGDLESDELLTTCDMLRDKNKRAMGRWDRYANEFGSFLKKIAVIGVVVASISFILISMTAEMGFHSGSTYLSGHAGVKGISGISSFSIELSGKNNDYSVPSSLSMLPWDMIVEPYRDTTLSISSFTIDDESVSIDDDYIVSWTINGFTYNGLEVVLNLENTGVIDASVSILVPSSSKHYGKRLDPTSRYSPKMKLYRDVTQIKNLDESAIPSYQMDFTIAVKYVRREIRSMSSSDVASLFDAMKILYTTDDTTGISTYGANYVSMETFSAKHLSGAGTVDCDHFHDGAGVASTHVSLTLKFEQSIQSIVPSIAMPYWESTLDNYLYDSLPESVVWGVDMFGEMVPSSSDHSLGDKSRWSDIAVPDGTNYQDWDISNTKTLNPYVNALNQLRSPWNNNPSSYITRYNKTYGVTDYKEYPTCQTLYSAFSSSSLGEMLAYLNGATHGPVHILIGGAWSSSDKFDSDTSSMKINAVVLLFKMLWRMGYTRCPTSCDSATDCSCSVPQEYIDTYGAYELLSKSDTLGYIRTVYGNDLSDEFYLKALKVIEDPGTVGDMFTSNAPWDPTFWSIHGTMERLLGLKRILYSQDELSFDETWTYGSSASKDVNQRRLFKLSSDSVCDWSGVSSADDLTLPSCSESVSCYGHGENDTLAFSNFFGTNDEYTNREFYEFIHPWSDTLPYTFDSFTYEYCNTYDHVDFLDGITDKVSFKGFIKKQGA